MNFEDLTEKLEQHTKGRNAALKGLALLQNILPLIVVAAFLFPIVFSFIPFFALISMLAVTIAITVLLAVDAYCSSDDDLGYFEIPFIDDDELVKSKKRVFLSLELLKAVPLCLLLTGVILSSPLFVGVGIMVSIVGTVINDIREILVIIAVADTDIFDDVVSVGHTIGSFLWIVLYLCSAVVICLSVLNMVFIPLPLLIVSGIGLIAYAIKISLHNRHMNADEKITFTVNNQNFRYKDSKKDEYLGLSVGFANSYNSILSDAYKCTQKDRIQAELDLLKKGGNKFKDDDLLERVEDANDTDDNNDKQNQYL